MADSDKVEALRRKAYGMAQSALREAHKDEFEALREEACRELGVEYVRRLTDRERAEAQLAALRAKFPDLA